MSKINAKQIKDYVSGTQYATLEDYLSGVNYYPLGFGTNRTKTVTSANVVALSSSDIPGTIAINASSTNNNGGVVVAQNAVATITGATTNFVDANGYIANLCEIRDATTNDPVLDSTTGKKVWGLLQAKSTASDGASIGASGSENIMMSFVILDNTDGLTLVSINGTIEFTYSKRYAKRFIPDKTIIGKSNETDVIQPYTPVVEKITVTSSFAANEVITLATGAGSATGTGTVSGTAVSLPASSSLFNTTATIRVYRNGVKQEKGTGLEVVWNSSASISFTEALAVGEVIEIEV